MQRYGDKVRNKTSYLSETDMKNFLAALVIGITLITSSLDAEAAKRLGGGLTFGRPAPTMVQKAPAAPSQGMTQRQAPQQNAARPAAAGAGAAAAAKPASPMRNMLMGAAAALGIAGLMSALGLSESFTSALMTVLLAVAVYYLVKIVLGLFLGARMQRSARRSRDFTQSYSQSAYGSEPQPQAARTYADQPAAAGSVMDQFSTPELSELSIPAGFDAAGFERVARENFAKLQLAWDTGNVVQISDFTTNELFIELTHQLRARGATAQKSEIIDVTAKLLGFTQQGDENVAVVEFNGAMKISGEFEEVHERWVLVQPARGAGGWLLAGIEQVA